MNIDRAMNLAVVGLCNVCGAIVAIALTIILSPLFFIVGCMFACGFRLEPGEGHGHPNPPPRVDSFPPRTKPQTTKVIRHNG